MITCPVAPRVELSGNIPTLLEAPFFSKDLPGILTGEPIYFFDPVFSFLYTLSIQEQIFIHYLT
jgi:hypothetical protein